MSLDITDLAREAYLAYATETENKNFQGLPMPDWEVLPQKIRQAWCGAVMSTVSRLTMHFVGEMSDAIKVAKETGACPG